jgi:L-aminopeptidase/D-esterase-like protein
VTLTAVPGVRVGHWTDSEARTGCTVVLLPEGTVASGEVRGGAPATREFDLLEPGRLVSRVDAVVLSGGSAFGLAAADGVARFCEERGMGFPTGYGPVPIVVGMCLFDLLVGDGSVRPGPAEGYAACEAASTGPVATGPNGAGTGATVAKYRGREHARPAGLGSVAVRRGDLVVAALMAVNAYGEPDGCADAAVLASAPSQAFANTTIGVVATNAALDKTGCLVVAQGGHDGLARALFPVHTRVDGDAVVAAAVGGVEAPVDLVRMLAVEAVERAARLGATP